MLEGPQGLPNESKSLSATMPTLPPGPRFLLQHIHYISLPPAAVFLGSILAQRLGDVNLPTFAIALAYLLSFPIFWFGYRFWRDLSVKRAAAARGAIVLPLAKLTKDIKFTGEERYPRRFSPGNLILACAPNFKLPGDFLFRLCEIWGHSFMLELYSFQRASYTFQYPVISIDIQPNLSVASQLFTTEPEHIKVSFIPASLRCTVW